MADDFANRINYYLISNAFILKCPFIKNFIINSNLIYEKFKIGIIFLITYIPAQCWSLLNAFYIKKKLVCCGHHKTFFYVKVIH